MRPLLPMPPKWQHISTMLHIYLTFATLPRYGLSLGPTQYTSTWLLPHLYNNRTHSFFWRSCYTVRALDARRYNLDHGMALLSGYHSLHTTSFINHSDTLTQGAERTGTVFLRLSDLSSYCQTSWLNRIGPLDRH